MRTQTIALPEMGGVAGPPFPLPTILALVDLACLRAWWSWMPLSGTLLVERSLRDDELDLPNFRELSDL